MLRFAIAIVAAACVAPRARLSNVGRAEPAYRVGSFELANETSRAFDCEVAPGPHWPAAEAALQEAIRAQSPSRRVVFTWLDNDRYIDYLSSWRPSKAPYVRADVRVELKIGAQGGYVSIHQRYGAVSYCVAIRRNGTTVDLVPAWKNTIIAD